jgi:hypothetical protein
VDIQQTPEERLKTVIYDIYTRLFYETVSDRWQVYCGQIWEKIVLWCDKYNYLEINTNEMGIEIYNVIKRLVKNNNEIIKNESEFFYILRKSMKNAENEYIRNNEQSLIKISKEKEQKLKRVDDSIRMKESQLGRKLTNDEKIQCISKWFKKQEYVDLINSKNVVSILYTSNDGNDEIDRLNFDCTHSVDPLDEYINKTDMKIILEAVKYLLDKKQERSRPCYKALFTLYCIKNDLKGLYPVLDQEIIDSYSNDAKKPTQYEIYLKYHSGIDIESAKAEASKNLHEFINNVKSYIKEKNI